MHQLSKLLRMQQIMCFGKKYAIQSVTKTSSECYSLCASDLKHAGMSISCLNCFRIKKKTKKKKKKTIVLPASYYYSLCASDKIMFFNQLYKLRPNATSSVLRINICNSVICINYVRKLRFMCFG